MRGLGRFLAGPGGLRVLIALGVIMALGVGPLVWEKITYCYENESSWEFVGCLFHDLPGR